MDDKELDFRNLTVEEMEANLIQRAYETEPPSPNNEEREAYKKKNLWNKLFIKRPKHHDEIGIYEDEDFDPYEESERIYRYFFHLCSAIILIGIIGILGQKIYVYTTIQEEVSIESCLEAYATTDTTVAIDYTIEKININTASALEIATLPGIGQITAEKIVNYRLEYGDYCDIKEIMNIKGISDKKFEAIKDYITVGE